MTNADLVLPALKLNEKPPNLEGCSKGNNKNLFQALLSFVVDSHSGRPVKRPELPVLSYLWNLVRKVLQNSTGLLM